jgi:phospholipase C
MRLKPLRHWPLIAGFLGLLLPAAGRAALTDITHIVVIYQENWSFDSMFGKFPGANGLANAGAAATQIDLSGTAWGSASNLTYSVGSASLPSFNPTLGMPVLEANTCGGTSYCYQPNGPWDLTPFLAPTGITSTDLPHKYYTEQMQIDGGLMDRFTSWNNTSLGLSMSYYDATEMPLGVLAQQYTLCDNFFHGAFGGSFLNHLWLVAAQPMPAPVVNGVPVVVDGAGNYVAVTNPAIAGYTSPGIPAGVTNSVDANLTRAGFPGGPFFINTSYSQNMPAPNTFTNAYSTTITCCYFPAITTTTHIGDFLSGQATPITWKWYSGGWTEANLSTATANADLFQFHHQPFNYWAEFAPGTVSRTAHLADESQFFSDLEADTSAAHAPPPGLPQVCFIKPIGANNEHPNYSSMMQGQEHVAMIVQAIQNSPYWAHTLIIVTHDEHGGRWDHVAPPGSAQNTISAVQSYYQANTLTADIWGPGLRVPTILISPYVRQGYVDHTVYETSSILKLIQDRWPSATAPGGPYLSPRVQAVNSLEAGITQAVQTPVATPVPASGVPDVQKTAFGPVPAHKGTPVCVYYEKPVSGSHWDIYNLAGQKAASLDFGSQASPCWDSSGAAPGIYMIRCALNFQDGSAKTVWNKVIIQN